MPESPIESGLRRWNSDKRDGTAQLQSSSPSSLCRRRSIRQRSWTPRTARTRAKRRSPNLWRYEKRKQSAIRDLSGSLRLRHPSFGASRGASHTPATHGFPDESGGFSSPPTPIARNYRDSQSNTLPTTSSVPFALNAGPKCTSVPGDHADADRAASGRDTPRYQGVRNPGSTSPFMRDDSFIVIEGFSRNGPWDTG